jgi:Mimiviridae putative ATP-dependent RNA helicase
MAAKNGVKKEIKEIKKDTPSKKPKTEKESKKKSNAKKDLEKKVDSCSDSDIEKKNEVSDISDNESEKSIIDLPVKKKSSEEKKEDSRKEYDKILKKHFGYDKLKDLQYEIIKNIIDGNDVLSLLPTSYGKSICYQMPFLITGKNVIVVSPLISLMEDQTRELNNKNIQSVCLNSANKQKNKDINDIYKGDAKIIYTTPEYLTNNPDLIENLEFVDKLALVAIDECHCISSWGHSFRSDYKNLDCIKQLAPNVPVLALTATATNKVIDDVVKHLDMDEPKIIKHSIDRPNLYLEIHQRNSNTLTDNVVPLLNENKDGKVIIYCKTISECDKVAEQLKQLKFNCESYNADKKQKDRTAIQKRYTEEDLDIIVATIAFGMGINIPNIRLMIHYNCSSDVESYMQEIGRAGRDGKDSKCYMFHSGQDFLLNDTFLRSIKNNSIRMHKRADINYLKKYVHTHECRRKCILKYFDEEVNNCQNCDNCLHQRYTRDISKEAYLLFALMSSLNNNLGLMTYIKLLLGVKDSTSSKYIDMVKNHYGKGKHYSKIWWEKMIRVLINDGYLKEERISKDKFIMVLKMTPKCATWHNLYKHNEKEKKPILEVSLPESFKKSDVEEKTDDQKTIDEFKKAFNMEKKPRKPASKKSTKTDKEEEKSDEKDNKETKKVVKKVTKRVTKK